MTPQQYLRGTRDSRRAFESTPTPLPRNQEAAYPQVHTPQLLSRKRQLEEPVSPQQGRKMDSTLRHPETTPPPYQNRDGSPTPRQPDMKPTGYQLKDPATPSRLMRPPDSPLTHRQPNLAPSGRETYTHSGPDRAHPLLNEQSPFGQQQLLGTPNREQKTQNTHGGQKTSPQFQSENRDLVASSTVRSQHPGMQLVTNDDEEEGDQEEDGEEEDCEEEHSEEDSGEDDPGTEEDGGGISEAAALDKSEDDVKATGRIFLYILRDAINDTKKGVEPKKAAEQNLLFATRSDSRPMSRNSIVANGIGSGIRVRMVL